MTLIPDLVAMTERFAREIIGLPIPDQPTRLEPERKLWAQGALSEELTEYMDAETLEDEADALLDLMYFAGGRLIEMGIVPGAAFEEVHLANMAKERGELSKRPHSKGFDAIKPEGWTPPDLGPYCNLRRDDVQTLDFMAQLIGDHPFPPERLRSFELKQIFMPSLPRILILGYARHGKDTVGEIMRDHYDMTFTSSSEFCAATVIMPAIEAIWERWNDPERGRNISQPTIHLYPDAQACFEDRGNHRKFWYDTIRAFNSPDLTALGRAIFEENDIYCGLRHKSEFHAVKNAGLADVVVWVDRSDHLPPEDADSCSVEPWMADFVIDNNGSLDDLNRNVLSLMDQIMGAS